MGVRHLSYKDLPAALRQKGAAQARQRMAMILSNPTLSAKDAEILQASLRKVDLWEQGRPLAPVRIPVAHSVSVSDTVEVAETLLPFPLGRLDVT